MVCAIWTVFALYRLGSNLELLRAPMGPLLETVVSWSWQRTTWDRHFLCFCLSLEASRQVDSRGHHDDDFSFPSFEKKKLLE